MNEYNDNSMSAGIMKRVYFIWFAKKIAPRVLAEMALFAGFLALIGHYVFVAKVAQYMGQIFENHSFDPSVWSGFAWHVFWKTRLIVQISVLGSLAMTALLFRNFITSVFRMAMAMGETKFIRR